MLWPGPDWRLQSLHISAEIPASAINLPADDVGGKSRLFVSLPFQCSDWEMKQEPGNPTTVILTPPPEAQDKARLFLAQMAPLLAPSQGSSATPSPP